MVAHATKRGQKWKRTDKGREKTKKMKKRKQNCAEFEVPDWAMPYAKAFLSLKYFPTIARAGV